MSIADKIAILQQDRLDIQTALRSKGVTVANEDGYSDFATKIGSIGSGTNAAANEILSGRVAFVGNANVTGTMNVKYFYTGNTTPSSSIGQNGDIYLQTV